MAPTPIPETPTGPHRSLRDMVLRVQPNLAEPKAELRRFWAILNLLQTQQARKGPEHNEEDSSSDRTLSLLPQRADEKPAGDSDDATLHSIFPTDYRKRAAYLSQDYQEVRQWFYQSHAFLEWLKGKSWHLCCYGERRSGKVVLFVYVKPDPESTLTNPPSHHLQLQWHDTSRRTLLAVIRMRLLSSSS